MLRDITNVSTLMSRQGVLQEVFLFFNTIECRKETYASSSYGLIAFFAPVVIPSFARIITLVLGFFIENNSNRSA